MDGPKAFHLARALACDCRSGAAGEKFGILLKKVFQYHQRSYLSTITLLQVSLLESDINFLWRGQ